MQEGNLVGSPLSSNFFAGKFSNIMQTHALKFTLVGENCANVFLKVSQAMSGGIFGNIE
jgi:hypothetical protein